MEKLFRSHLFRVTQSRTRLKQLSMHACIGEGNGNPLQYSCMKNPRDRGAWWAAVYGVTQSQTRLQQLSSSNSIYQRQLMVEKKTELVPTSPPDRLINIHS